MPRRPMSPQSRYHSALQAVETILAQNTIEDLRENRKLYRSTNRSDLKIFDALYRKFIRNKKTIDDYESLHPPSRCENCKRKVVNSQTSFYNLNLVNRSSACLKRRKFKHVRCPSNPIRLFLCLQCDRYLLSDEINTSCNMEWAWPSYVWYILSNKDVQLKYQSQIWKYIPRAWRPWWTESVKDSFIQIYQSIDSDNPSPFFEDKTLEIRDWEHGISKASTF